MGTENKQLTPLSHLGEFGLIERIAANIACHHPSTIRGIGDDAAVIDPQCKLLLLSTDMLVEGVHFNLMYMPLKHLGYKAVVVNLSDIYAMNGQPAQITVSLAVSGRFTVEAIDELYEGMRLACAHYGVDLVGGDTTSSLKGMIISIAVTGFALPEEVVYRNGARVGDLICVTGDLGAAYLGLQVLEREKQVYLANPHSQPELAEYEYLVGRQLKPEARNTLRDFFASSGMKPTSMIDISDGLSSEILHICRQSGTGALIYEDRIPLAAETIRLAAEFNLDPVVAALNGGEDYELLFTCPVSEYNKLKDSELIHVVGHVEPAEKGCHLASRDGSLVPLQAQGWNALHDDSLPQQ